MEIRRAALYCKVEESVVDVLGQEGIAPGIAEKAAVRLTETLIKGWGGQTIYFPRDASGVAARRSAQIMAEFTGRNFAALAAKYGYTEQGIRRLIQRARHSSQSAQS